MTDCHEDDDEEAEGAEERAKRKGQADEEKDRVDSVLAGLGEVLEQVKEVIITSLNSPFIFSSSLFVYLFAYLYSSLLSLYLSFSLPSSTTPFFSFLHFT